MIDSKSCISVAVMHVEMCKLKLSRVLLADTKAPYLRSGQTGYDVISLRRHLLVMHGLLQLRSTDWRLSSCSSSERCYAARSLVMGYAATPGHGRHTRMPVRDVSCRRRQSTSSRQRP